MKHQTNGQIFFFTSTHARIGTEILIDTNKIKCLDESENEWLIALLMMMTTICYSNACCCFINMCQMLSLVSDRPSGAIQYNCDQMSATTLNSTQTIN